MIKRQRSTKMSSNNFCLGSMDFGNSFRKTNQRAADGKKKTFIEQLFIHFIYFWSGFINIDGVGTTRLNKYILEIFFTVYCFYLKILIGYNPYIHSTWNYKY